VVQHDFFSDRVTVQFLIGGIEGPVLRTYA
jgi:hypothetical protein